MFDNLAHLFLILLAILELYISHIACYALSTQLQNISTS